jgi:putative membrane protein
MLPLTKPIKTMKKLNLFIATACTIFAMQACHNGATSSATDSTSTTTADITKTDTTKLAATVDTTDTAFVNKAVAGGMTEVQLSQLAQRKTADPKIRDFATMMVTDHTEAGTKLVGIAKQENIPVPNGPDAEQKILINDMSEQNGSDFNKVYVNQMVDDHTKTIALFESMQKTVKDTALKAFITNTLPTLHKHLDAINAIKSSMK